MNFFEKDFVLKKSLKLLAKQETRCYDSGNPTLFKIVNSIGNDMFFLTRKNLNEYIEVLSGNCQELEELLEVVKRNF